MPSYSWEKYYLIETKLFPRMLFFKIFIRSAVFGIEFSTMIKFLIASQKRNAS
jgi:hypothetical protein